MLRRRRLRGAGGRPCLTRPTRSRRPPPCHRCGCVKTCHAMSGPTTGPVRTPRSPGGCRRRPNTSSITSRQPTTASGLPRRALEPRSLPTGGLTASRGPVQEHGRRVHHAEVHARRVPRRAERLPAGAGPAHHPGRLPLVDGWRRRHRRAARRPVAESPTRSPRQHVPPVRARPDRPGALRSRRARSPYVHVPAVVAVHAHHAPVSRTTTHPSAATTALWSSAPAAAPRSTISSARPRSRPSLPTSTRSSPPFTRTRSSAVSPPTASVIGCRGDCDLERSVRRRDRWGARHRGVRSPNSSCALAGRRSPVTVSGRDE
jgi:hypothetical protein